MNTAHRVVPLSVLLRPDDLRTVRRVAHLRNGETHRRELRDHIHDTTRSGLAAHELGAAAELGVSRWAGIPWPASVNGWHERPDLGTRTEVRGTNYRSGSLIIRPRDRRERRYVLAYVALPTVHLLGWVEGTVGRDLEYWHGDSWWIPQPSLRSMAEIYGPEVQW